MFRIFRLSAAVLALGLFLSVAPAQSKDDYRFDLPSGWEQSQYTDGATIERIEYIYRDRNDALLKVKRMRVNPSDRTDDIANRDIDVSVKIFPGYVRGKSEAFGGGANAGVFIQFDFTKAGKPMLGRYYYLRSDESTLWVLQFTGNRSVLGPLRNETDQMARSFQQK